jgi:hypothetical protein
LGALERQLNVHGSGMIEAVRQHLRRYVGAGVKDVEDKQTVVLLIVPLRRYASGDVERVDARAFWVDADPITLGLDAGALVREYRASSSIFADHMRSDFAAATGWRDRKLVPLTVLSCADEEMGRRICGNSNAGPQAVIAGVGALGSNMLDLWRRCGWGTWDAIDPDHMRPHNVLRHATAFTGCAKADAVAMHDANLWRTRNFRIGAINNDVTDLDDPRVKHALERAALIIDATTTLEAPRFLAQQSLTARIVSTFLTPTGDDAVLIAEDSERRFRVDTLEAQYWRAVLNEEWGDCHLTKPGATFRSGGSCRDVSAVIPYSSIVLHAAILAQQIQSLPLEPMIRIWEREPSVGSVSVHEIDVARPIECSMGLFTIIWDEHTRAKVRALRTDALPSETGGVLVGYHDFVDQRIYVVDALPAPPDSEGTPDGFRRGIEGLVPAIEQCRRRSAGHVSYIGEWHSHPEGAAARASKWDLRQLLFLGEVLAQDGLPGLQLIVAANEEEWLVIR